MSAELTTEVRTSGMEDLTQDPTEARKALESIDIRLTNKPISLLQHKIYNVWVAFAQSTVNASETRIFEFPLSEVMELCGFDSNNHAYFIDAARELLELRVEYNSMARYGETSAARLGSKAGASASAKKPARTAKPTARWSAAQLVSYIEIDSGANLMRVEFPEILRQQILRPDLYRAVDLRKQQLFTSRAGLTLYEYVLTFAAAQNTPWLEWESYSMLLSGSIEAHKTFREFSKMLNRAIEQVNAHHESHQVRAEYTKRGRAIEKMRIVISLKHQAQLSLEQGMAPAPELVRALTALGLSAAEAVTMSSAHPRAYLESQIAYVRRRLADRDRGPLKVPAAYLRSAVAGNYAVHKASDVVLPHAAMPEGATSRVDVAAMLPSFKPVSAASAPAVGPAPTADALAYAKVKQWYAEAADDRRQSLANGFLRDANPTVRKILSTKGMSSPIVQNAFYGWLLKSGQFDADNA